MLPLPMLLVLLVLLLAGVDEDDEEDVDAAEEAEEEEDDDEEAEAEEELEETQLGDGAARLLSRGPFAGAPPTTSSLTEDERRQRRRRRRRQRVQEGRSPPHSPAPGRKRGSGPLIAAALHLSSARLRSTGGSSSAYRTELSYRAHTRGTARARGRRHRSYCTLRSLRGHYSRVYYGAPPTGVRRVPTRRGRRDELRESDEGGAHVPRSPRQCRFLSGSEPTNCLALGEGSTPSPSPWPLALRGRLRQRQARAWRAITAGRARRTCRARRFAIEWNDCS